MPLQFDTSEQLLDFVSEEGVGRTHAQGFDWYWDQFQPALQYRLVVSEDEKNLLADCYYVAGDVHDFNNAPLAAIEEYTKCLKLDPENAAAFREIASMQLNFGDLESAIKNSDRALVIDPKDRHAAGDNEWIRQLITEADYVPLYEKNDIEWEVFEALARNETNKAIVIAQRLRADTEKRALACALGAQSQTDDYLKAWKAIVKNAEVISFEYADWFFMPQKIYDSPEIWRMFLESNIRYDGVFTFYESWKKSQALSALTTYESIKLKIEYYLYETENDISALKKLSARFPEWSELSEAIAEIS
ncbi:hypothetical protein [Hyphococcus sp.]|uniref:hypothetical protein n=1 Tax=Hyphococcus sp. TaxID=2038636 RepID=UPI003CCBC1CD